MQTGIYINCSIYLQKICESGEIGGQMTMKKIILLGITIILIASVLMSCESIPWNSPVKEDANSASKKSNYDNAQAPLNPTTENVLKEQVIVMLYFGYTGDSYLASDMRTVKIPVTKRIEQVIVEELLKGPISDKLELETLFNPNVRVIMVSDNNDYIFVTLSKEFLINPDPKKISQNDFNISKKLAIYSIVNSLTELGRFSRVQILIDAENNEQGARIKRKDAGFIGDSNQEQLLEPLARDAKLILSPENTVRAMMKAFIEKDWDKVYGYLATKDNNQVLKPEPDEFRNTLVSVAPTLDSSEILDGTISNDGQTAVVTTNYKIKMKNSKSVEYILAPLRLIRERQMWKIVFPAISSIFEKK